MPNLPFGKQLRSLRVRGRDPQNGRTLTQARLAELLSDLVGFDISGATVSYWEKGRSRFPATPRKSLLNLLRILHTESALTVAEAEALILAGDYGDLTTEEQALVFGQASPAQYQVAAPHRTTAPIFIPHATPSKNIVVGQNYFFVRIVHAQAACLGNAWPTAGGLAVISKVAVKQGAEEAVWALQQVRPIKPREVLALELGQGLTEVLPANMQQVDITLDYVVDAKEQFSALAKIINAGTLRAPVSFEPSAAAANQALSKLTTQLVDNFILAVQDPRLLHFNGCFSVLDAGWPEGYYVWLGSPDDQNPLPTSEAWGAIEVRERQLWYQGKPVTQWSYIILDVRCVAARTRDLGQATAWNRKLREAESHAQSLADNPLASKAERQQGWDWCVKLLQEARTLLLTDPTYLPGEAQNIITSVYAHCLRQLEENIRNSPLKSFWWPDEAKARAQLEIPGEAAEIEAALAQYAQQVLEARRVLKTSITKPD